MLIEVDISAKLVEDLMIERVGKSFFIELAYENLSAFLFDMFFNWPSFQ